MTKKRIVTTAIVVGVLGALVYLQVQHWRSFEWSRFWSASRVEPLHLVAAIVLIYVTYFLRALRWKVFLEPVRETGTWDLVPATFIGFTGLALLGRPGEFIRPYLIARRENLSLASQIGAWTVERIFDVGAFTVLMTFDVFFSSAIRVNPYLHKFKVAALALKVRAFGEGLNTIAGVGSFVKLVVISVVMWFMIALAYREVAHSYPPEAAQEGPAVVDVETANMAGLPEIAGQPLTDDTVASLNTALATKGFSIRTAKGDLWLFRQNRRVKKVGDRPHLANMDVPHVLLLMGFSMVGSVVQLPAVGGGSQLAVISALQVVYGIPPEAALSCGIVLWLVTFMSCVPVGLVFAHRGHLSLRKLSKASHEQQNLAEAD